jgi:hypothetical protein
VNLWNLSRLIYPLKTAGGNTGQDRIALGIRQSPGENQNPGRHWIDLRFQLEDTGSAVRGSAPLSPLSVEGVIAMGFPRQLV